MKVSQVEIIPIRPKKGLIGFATVEMDDQLLLHSIGIHRKKDGSGYRLTYPTRSGYASDKSVFHPIAPDLSKEIERCVFQKVNEILNF
ncbi:MAG: septation protein SpoVG family protein [Chlamydiales bacterium]|nr:septation protein SpoVG family protein [Chlamydiales bacterium]